MPQDLIQIDNGYSITIEDLVDKAFYGARQNRQTGQAFIDIITGDDPIVLPSSYETRAEDYLNWMWSYNTFRYSFDNATGRLLLEVL